MADHVYLLRLADDAQLLQAVVKRLGLEEAPYYLRLATRGPLSSFGYPEGSEAALLAWHPDGLTLGVAQDLAAPRTFVPWGSILYLAEGDLMKEWSDFLIQQPQANWEEFLIQRAESNKD